MRDGIGITERTPTGGRRPIASWRTALIASILRAGGRAPAFLHADRFVQESRRNTPKESLIVFVASTSLDRAMPVAQAWDFRSLNGLFACMEGTSVC
jgi:hypothetical protein